MSRDLPARRRDPPRRGELTILDQDGVELSPLAAVDALTSPERLEMLGALSARVDEACRSLLTDADVEDMGGREVWKKSAFRKLGRAFGIRLETVEAEFEWRAGPDPERPMCVGRARVRATAPWGQEAVAAAHCTSREDSFYRKSGGTRIPVESSMAQAEHRTVAIAETRAANRAIDDLLAIGRAEDVLSEEAEAEAREARRRRELDELAARWERLLTELDVTDEEEAAFCELFRARGDAFDAWGPADRQRAIATVERRGREAFEKALAYARSSPCPVDGCSGRLGSDADVCPECGSPSDGPPPAGEGESVQTSAEGDHPPASEDGPASVQTSAEGAAAAAETEAEAFERSIRQDPTGDGRPAGLPEASPLERKAELVAMIATAAEEAGLPPERPAELLADVQGLEDGADRPELRLAAVGELEQVLERLGAEIEQPDEATFKAGTG